MPLPGVSLNASTTGNGLLCVKTATHDNVQMPASGQQQSSGGVWRPASVSASQQCTASTEALQIPFGCLDLYLMQDPEALANHIHRVHR